MLLSVIISIILTLVGAFFDEKLAKTSVRLCGAAYCCIAGCEDWQADVCQKYFQSMEGNVTEIHAWVHDVHGLVGLDPQSNTIRLAFTGTNPVSILDWIDDFKLRAVPYAPCAKEGCIVHHGFLDAYEQIRTKVVAAYQHYHRLAPDAKVTITGHSLGGAIATHATLDLLFTQELSTEDLVALYTFGQPRLGNAPFIDLLTSLVGGKYYRLVYRHDLVPHHPYQARGFHHAPVEVYYPQNQTSYVLCDEHIGDDPACADRDHLHNWRDHLVYMGFNFVTNYFQCSLPWPRGRVDVENILELETKGGGEEVVDNGLQGRGEVQAESGRLLRTVLSDKEP